jgi:simple sugar transport system substrate-binding protein/basic membrane protein A
MFKVAEDYPDVNFAWPGGIGKTAENVADYDQPFYQAAYIMGTYAAGMSESGTLSFLSGFDIPVCHSMMEAFKAGAEEVNPDVEVLYTVVGDWADVGKAKEAVLAHVDAGADYVASCGFGPTQGAIAAAEEAGIYASSYVGDMSSIAPDNVAVNMVWDLHPLLSQMVDEIESGTFRPGKYYSLGVAEGSLAAEINPRLEDQIPEEVREKAKSVVDSIVNGTFEVPYVPEAQE